MKRIGAEAASDSGIWLLAEHAARVAAGEWSDPHWASVVWGCHFEGADASTTFTDVKGATGTAVGNASIQTDTSKFGASSGYFDGTGDYVTYPDSVNYEFDGSFTLSGWVSLTPTGSLDTSQPVPISKGSAADSSFWGVQILQSQLYFYAKTAAGASSYLNLNYGKSVVGGWHHIEVGRSASNLYLFLDGTLLGSTSSASTPELFGTIGANANTLTLGAWGTGANPYLGYLDDWLITKGVCRHTASFTPPAAPFRDY